MPQKSWYERWLEEIIEKEYAVSCGLQQAAKRAISKKSADIVQPFFFGIT